MEEDTTSNFGKEDEDFIIFSLDSDDEMNNLGKIIGTKYSREFLKITQNIDNKELNLKEIAKIVEKTDNPRLPNPTHHKNRLEKLGLVIGKLKLQRKNGHTLRYYKGKKIIVITTDKIAKKMKEDKAFSDKLNKFSE